MRDAPIKSVSIGLFIGGARCASPTWLTFILRIDVQKQEHTQSTIEILEKVLSYKDQAISKTTKIRLFEEETMMSCAQQHNQQPL